MRKLQNSASLFFRLFFGVSKMEMKIKNPILKTSLPDLVLDALEESRIGRIKFKGASAYEITRRINRTNHGISDNDVEEILEELVKAGLLYRIEPDPPLFLRNRNKNPGSNK